MDKERHKVEYLHDWSPECWVPARSLCALQEVSGYGQGLAAAEGRGISGLLTTKRPEYTWGGGGKAASYGLKNLVS